jgi:molybdopterin molybdotransferase
MNESYPMLSVEEALDRVLKVFRPLPPERRPILEALGQVLAEDICAGMDIPPLANSAMDGYAVRCDDTSEASSEQPRRLRVVADLAAGYVLDAPIHPGTAVRIMTGAPVPPGAEAVIPFEEVERDGDEILVFRQYPHLKNIRAAGEDVRAGQMVLAQGTVLRPQEIGMLAAWDIRRRSYTAARASPSSLPATR